MKGYHYHVRENDPASMPEQPPAAFDTKREAHAHAASLAASLREDGYKVVGSQGDYDAEDAEGNMRVIRTDVCRDAECIRLSREHPDW